MIQQPNGQEDTEDLQRQHDDIKAKRAWLELMRDEFRPHSMLSMNSYSRSAADLRSAETLLIAATDVTITANNASREHTFHRTDILVHTKRDIATLSVQESSRASSNMPSA